MNRLLVLVILMFLSLHVAVAEVLIGSVLEACESSNTGICYGYIEAVSDAAEGKNWNGYEYCLPNEVSVEQLDNIVTNYLNEHHADFRLGASSLVDKALGEAYPCPK